MKLNNHVPHRLKKRTLKLIWNGKGSKVPKSKGILSVMRQPSYRYHELLKLMKDVSQEAFRYLSKRLRIRGIVNDRYQTFQGKIVNDFVWSRTPQGAAFWKTAEDVAREYFKEKDSGMLNSIF